MIEARSERSIPHGSFIDRIREKWQETRYPASTEAKKSFEKIIGILPKGDLQESMKLVQKDLTHILSAQDSQLFWANIAQRFLPPMMIGPWAAGFGGLIGGGITLSPVGAIAGAAIGAEIAGLAALAGPSASDLERGRIRAATAQQEMLLRTRLGKGTAALFDARDTDNIVKAILYGGMSSKGGGSAILAEAST